MKGAMCSSLPPKFREAGLSGGISQTLEVGCCLCPGWAKVWGTLCAWEDAVHAERLSARAGLFQEGEPLSVPKSGLLSNTPSAMNCPRRHMYWQSKRLYWKEAPMKKAGGEGNPGGLLCHLAPCLRFYWDGVSFLVVSGPLLWLRVLLAGTLMAQTKWISAGNILGGR